MAAFSCIFIALMVARNKPVATSTIFREKIGFPVLFAVIIIVAIDDIYNGVSYAENSFNPVWNTVVIDLVSESALIVITIIALITIFIDKRRDHTLPL
ncbi:MAG TPA: hypothetical protein VLX61_01795 [Anaerolineales bacterium]|nr:hypothetical protein [Anaerolineales bacterium]